MKQFVFKLETLSPLAIRADHAQGGSETTQYISGTTLLGSLASAHRFMHPDREDEFADLFLRGNVQYPDLYSSSFKDSGMQEAETPVYPVPKTAQSCKRFGGFKHDIVDDDEEPHHGVRDTLIDWLLFDIKSIADADSTRDRKRLDLMKHYKECPECQSSMDHFSRYYRRDEFSPENIMSANIKTRLQTHTGINRQTGTVQQSILYNREVLEEGMRFWGVVNVADEPDTLADTFEKFVNEVGKEGLVRIGTGRTRGMGKVSFGIAPFKDEQNTFDSFKERLKAFNETIQAQAKEFHITMPDAWYFAVALHAPAIIRDEQLRYEGTLTAETLARLASVPADTFSGFSQVYQSASTRSITGWNELWGTPKTNDYAIETGSVFLFAGTREPDETLYRTLYTLEKQGIGQRRAEGFGRILISDPFHREVEML